MSRIFNLDFFDSERFTKIKNPTDVQIGECIVFDSLEYLKKATQDVISQEIILESGYHGFIDAILIDMEEPISEEYEVSKESEKIKTLLINLLSKISESYGRLAKEFGRTDPFFYGYLTFKEVKDLMSILTNLPDSLNNGWLAEFKDELLIICEQAVQKNLGLIYWALP